jgi:tetratricopeptide (TPR) repeat protein
MWRSLRLWWLSRQKPKMTAALREFNERMRVETQRGTHSQFLESVSRGEARAYQAAFDRWLVRDNPEATDEDYYWRSLLTRYFFPDPKREKADLERAVELNPGNVDLWVSLGHMAADRKQWGEAVRCYEAGIRALPQNFFPWYGRAGAYWELGRYEEALRDINVAIGIHPNLSYGYETRGLIHDAMGQPEEAVADLEFALGCRAARPWTRRLRDELRRKL